MNYHGKSYIGRRSSNQDRFLCITDNGYTLLVVADGMGGHKGGEIASQMAVDILEQTLLTLPITSLNVDLKAILVGVFSKIDDAIAEYAGFHPQMKGMGTTLSCALVVDNRFVVGNIGDSRVYHNSGDKLIQLTIDDTLIQNYISQFGNNVPEDLHRSGHVLTKALNGDGDVPTIYPEGRPHYILENRDFLVLVSDGLISSKVDTSFDGLYKMLISYGKMNDFCEQLICFAYHQGSQDNCTVVIGGLGNLKASHSKGAILLPYPPNENRTPLRSASTGIGQSSKGKSFFQIAIMVITLMVVVISFYYAKDILTTINNLAVLQNSENGHSDDGKMAIDWPIGFTQAGDTVQVPQNEQIDWNKPLTELNLTYIINIYNNKNIVRSDTVLENTYIWAKYKPLKNNIYEIKLEAIHKGITIKPKEKSNIFIVIKR